MPGAHTFVHTQYMLDIIIVILIYDVLLTWGLSQLAGWPKLKFLDHYYILQTHCLGKISLASLSDNSISKHSPTKYFTASKRINFLVN